MNEIEIEMHGIIFGNERGATWFPLYDPGDLCAMVAWVGMRDQSITLE